MFDFQYWQTLIQEFHFMRPLWLLALVPFTLILMLRWKRESDNDWQTALPKHLQKELSVHDQGWKKNLPLKLLSIVVILGVLIASGPTWQRQPSPFGEDKSPMLIVLDVNDSMLSKDTPPSRLERAKQKILEILATRDGGATGLIAYSGSAHVVMPLTPDTTVFPGFLKALHPKMMPREGKFAQHVLPLVEQQFAKSPVPGTVIMVTDGVSGDAIEPFADFFSEHPHQLLILGMGDPDFPSNLPPDHTSLDRLTSAAGGDWIQVTVEQSDVEWLASQVVRHLMISSDSALPWEDMGYYLVWVLALFLLLWFRRGWSVQWAIVLAIGMASPVDVAIAAPTVEFEAEKTEVEKVESHWFMDLWMTPDQQGQWYLDRGEYVEAAKRFQDPLMKGVSYYYSVEFKKAHHYFMMVDSDEGMFNAGLALARQREYVAARALYKKLKEKNPDYPGVDANIAAIDEIIMQVNLMSEGQSGTFESAEQGSRELPDDEPVTGDGHEEMANSKAMQQETLSADEILKDSQVADKWLQKVEANPAGYLNMKFSIQNLKRDQEAAK